VALQMVMSVLGINQLANEIISSCFSHCFSYGKLAMSAAERLVLFPLDCSFANFYISVCRRC
jgi:hypothetical protein